MKVVQPGWIRTFSELIKFATPLYPELVEFAI